MAESFTQKKHKLPIHSLAKIDEKPKDTLGTIDLIEYTPTKKTNLIFILAHGAGAGQDHPWMKQVSSGLATLGVTVFTFNFLYIQKKKRTPDPGIVLESTYDQVVQYVSQTKNAKTSSLFIGGKSMGGRISTQLAAKNSLAIRGLICFGYPLHPPGKPEQLRTSHFKTLKQPILFFQGTKDSFGSPKELSDHTKSLFKEIISLEDADHSFKLPAKKRAEQELLFENLFKTSLAWMKKHA